MLNFACSSMNAFFIHSLNYSYSYSQHNYLLVCLITQCITIFCLPYILQKNGYRTFFGNYVSMLNLFPFDTFSVSHSLTQSVSHGCNLSTFRPMSQEYNPSKKLYKSQNILGHGFSIILNNYSFNLKCCNWILQNNFSHIAYCFLSLHIFFAPT